MGFPHTWQSLGCRLAATCFRGSAGTRDRMSSAMYSSVTVTGNLLGRRNASLRKPDPGIFHVAAARCGQPLIGGWMTGDNPDTDITGAHGVGLRTLWIAAGRTWTHDAPPAEHSVDNALAAIIHLLAQ